MKIADEEFKFYDKRLSELELLNANVKSRSLTNLISVAKKKTESSLAVLVETHRSTASYLIKQNSKAGSKAIKVNEHLNLCAEKIN